jgi:arsenate reductase (thioredoxin)
MKKYKIAFVCVHNSCRSQMAEAITKKLALDLFEPYSAGTETKPKINQDAVRIIKQLYDVDMNLTQRSKLLDDIPQELDVLVTMGCNVECPFIPTQHREDWGLDDPSGLPDEAFIKTAELIREKLLSLKNRIQNGEIKLK